MSVKKSVVVLDYGFGNVRSAVRALEHIGLEVKLTSDFETAMAADGLVIPVVGAFAACMAGIEAVNGPALVDARLIAGAPILGICVGMQIMFDRGIEHDQECNGLGQWPGTVTKLPASITPHMGWNTVQAPEDSLIFAGLAHESFYFVHSYAAQEWAMTDTDKYQKPPLVTWCNYESPFVAAVENGPLTAVQFHPEKSGEAGLGLLRNWALTLT